MCCSLGEVAGVAVWARPLASPQPAIAPSPKGPGFSPAPPLPPPGSTTGWVVLTCSGEGCHDCTGGDDFIAFGHCAPLVAGGTGRAESCDSTGLRLHTFTDAQCSVTSTHHGSERVTLPVGIFSSTNPRTMILCSAEPGAPWEGPLPPARTPPPTPAPPRCEKELHKLLQCCGTRQCWAGGELLPAATTPYDHSIRSVAAVCMLWTPRAPCWMPLRSLAVCSLPNDVTTGLWAQVQMQCGKGCRRGVILTGFGVEVDGVYTRAPRRRSEGHATYWCTKGCLERRVIWRCQGRWVVGAPAALRADVCAGMIRSAPGPGDTGPSSAGVWEEWGQLGTEAVGHSATGWRPAPHDAHVHCLTSQPASEETELRAIEPVTVDSDVTDVLSESFALHLTSVAAAVRQCGDGAQWLAAASVYDSAAIAFYPNARLSLTALPRRSTMGPLWGPAAAAAGIAFVATIMMLARCFKTRSPARSMFCPAPTVGARKFEYGAC